MRSGNEQLAALVRSYREAKRLTVREVNARIGRSSGYVSQIESGQMKATDDMLFKLCEVLDIDPHLAFYAANRIPPDCRGGDLVKAQRALKRFRKAVQPAEEEVASEPEAPVTQPLPPPPEEEEEDEPVEMETEVFERVMAPDYF